MRRPDRADFGFLAAAAIALPILLGLGAGLTFFSDEWAFIESRSLGDASTWFAPHNEHWATVPVLVYRALVETVGLGSYMPYLAVLIGLHIVVSALVYTLVRRASGRWLALAASVVVLFLGSGFENLYWAFQMTFVGSTALGLAAILAFDVRPPTRGRTAAGTALLVLSLMTSGIGLVFCVVVGVELLLDPQRRRVVPMLNIPAAIYGIWFIAIGREAIDSHRGPFSLGGVGDMIPAIISGFGNAVGAVIGAGPAGSEVAFAIFAVGYVGWSIRRRRLDLPQRTVACLAGIATLYVLIGLARAFVAIDLGEYTRYTYESAVMLIVGLAPLIGRPVFETPPQRRVWLLAGGVVLALSLIWNVRLLIAGRALFVDRAWLTRALVAAGLERPLPASTDPDRSLVLVPSPNELSRIVASYGSPVSDSLVPWAVTPIPDSVRIEANRRVREGAQVPLPSSFSVAP